jgi:Bacterial SH3 domain
MADVGRLKPNKEGAAEEYMTMRYGNLLGCLHFRAVFLIVFLLSACAPGPPPATAPARLTAQVVNVKHFLPVRGAPSLNAMELGRLLPGEGVYVTQDNGEWCTVESMRLQNGQPLVGWVLRQYIMLEGPAGSAVPPGQGGPQGPGGPQGMGGPQRQGM